MKCENKAKQKHQKRTANQKAQNMRNTCEKQAGKPIKWKNMQAKIHTKMQVLFRFFPFRRFLFAVFPLYFVTFFPICLEEICENAKHIKK